MCLERVHEGGFGSHSRTTCGVALSVAQNDSAELEAECVALFVFLVNTIIT